MKLPDPRSLRWGLLPRIYLHLLFSLLVMVLVAAALAAVLFKPPRHLRDMHEAVAASAAEAVEAGGEDPQALLDELEEKYNFSMTLYSPDGELLAASPSGPVELPKRLERRGKPPPGGGPRPQAPHPIIMTIQKGPAAGNLLVAGGLPPSILTWVVVLALGIFLIGAMLSSYLFVRRVVRPLSQLSSAVRRFGEGELEARVHSGRRDELGALSRTFDQMADRIGHLIHGQKELLANVSHELRTPLSRIRVALDITDMGDKGDASAPLAGISEDLTELEELLSDIIFAARLNQEPGRTTSLPLKVSRFDPRDLLEDAVTGARTHNPAREVLLSLNAPLPAVDADPRLMRRALDNLLQNALRYSGPEAPVEVSAREADDLLVIQVKDQGMGISEQDLEQIFEPFFRAERSRAKATGGTGLGLTLVRSIMEAHRGAVRITSAPDQGTTARLEFPLNG